MTARRSRRRRIGLVAALAGGVIALAAAWIVITGLMARDQLNQARAGVVELRARIAAGDLAGASTIAATIGRHARNAHRLTSGPAWAVGSALPGGGPLRIMRVVAASVDELGHSALPQVVTASQGLNPATLRGPDGTVDLATFTRAASALDTATRTVSAATKAIAALPPGTWLSPINSARTAMLTQLTSLGKTVTAADVATHVVPAILGADGPKRYFVAFQNEAEARGTGGLPGAFAVMEADHGRVKFLRFETNVLGGVSADVDFGPAYNQLYDGAATTTMYGNANLSPHFPYAAQIWISMWHKATGQKLDGAIAIDPTALSYLLAVTGPAALPDGTQVNAANIVALTQSAVYSKFDAGTAGNAARRVYLLNIARSASNRIVTSRADPTALVRAGAQAAGERRLLVWSADPSVETWIAQTSVSGAIPVSTAPYVGLSIVNDGGNKLDYYLDRTLVWKRTGCGTTRQVTVTITLTNNAPATGLSTYVTGRSDRHSYPVKTGDNRLEVSYLATAGALMSSVTINDKTATARVGAEHGHPLYTVDLELPRGTARTIALHLVEPVGVGAPIVLRQPLVRPLQVSVQDTSCG